MQKYFKAKQYKLCKEKSEYSNFKYILYKKYDVYIIKKEYLYLYYTYFIYTI